MKFVRNERYLVAFCILFDHDVTSGGRVWRSEVGSPRAYFVDYNMIVGYVWSCYVTFYVFLLRSPLRFVKKKINNVL
jgi:hypothetical protein